ncbi:MAG: PhnD/SsuA/transferrin family substrate-binding protein [Chromatiaceae bacterium]|nr:PhnD/SsuA/transferrin family substrate-binding protein [Chromatiaceae bacterium]MCF7994901.1 PhnD/SsuA/transferrin family substrate-binding protein [Chromatiaceae bacterium]MCF8015376.1 PhnD/SsuA/transferrin family substrate-binding protein [Chromatiaceae bacterium]
MTAWSRRSVLQGLLTIAPTLLAPGLARSAERSGCGEVLRFGVTPVILDNQVGFLNRWSAWLSEQLGCPVELVQRTRYQDIVDLLLREQLHLAWVCGYPYVQQQDQLELLAVPHWHGQPLYRSEIIVARAAPFQGLEDLRGGLFAWTDPLSNSGWLYPHFLLQERGLEPKRLFRRSIFTWGHARSVQAVAEGLVDGAAVDSYVRETLLRYKPTLAQETRVIERSPWFGFPPIVAGPALEAGQRSAVRDTLLGQAESAAGEALLSDLNLDGFSREDPRLYATIATMAEQLQLRTQA